MNAREVAAWAAGEIGRLETENARLRSDLELEQSLRQDTIAVNQEEIARLRERLEEARQLLTSASIAAHFGLDHADRWPLCSYMTCQHNRAFLASLEVVDAAGNRGVNNG